MWDQFVVPSWGGGSFVVTTDMEVKTKELRWISAKGQRSSMCKCHTLSLSLPLSDYVCRCGWQVSPSCCTKWSQNAPHHRRGFFCCCCSLWSFKKKSILKLGGGNVAQYQRNGSWGWHSLQMSSLFRLFDQTFMILKSSVTFVFVFSHASLGVLGLS